MKSPLSLSLSLSLGPWQGNWLIAFLFKGTPPTFTLGNPLPEGWVFSVWNLQAGFSYLSGVNITAPIHTTETQSCQKLENIWSMEKFFQVKEKLRNSTLSRGKWTFLWNVKGNYALTRLIKYHWWLENPFGVSVGKGKGGKDELYKGSGIFYFNQRKFGKFIIKNRSNVWGKHAHYIVPCTVEPCLKHPPPL